MMPRHWDPWFGLAIEFKPKIRLSRGVQIRVNPTFHD